MIKLFMVAFIFAILLTSPIIIFGAPKDTWFYKQRKYVWIYFIIGLLGCGYIVAYPKISKTIETLNYMQVHDALYDDVSDNFTLKVWTPAGHYQFIEPKKVYVGAPESKVYKNVDVAKYDIPILTPFYNWLFEDFVYYVAELNSSQWISTRYEED